MNIEIFSKKLNSLEPQSVINFQADFHELMRNFDVQKHIAKNLRECLADHKKVPPITSPTALNLASETWFNIDLLFFNSDTDADTLITHAMDSIHYFLSPAEIVLYSLKNYNNKIYSNSASVEFEKSTSISAGEIISIDANKEILNLKSNKVVSVISISNKSMFPYAWKFNASTGKPICHFNIYPVNTVLELISKFLGAYGDENSIDCLKLLLNHQSDTIKWEAANSLSSINLTEGVNAFSKLTHSDNMLVSSAANDALKLLKRNN
jgi:hypothetical protein